MMKKYIGILVLAVCIFVLVSVLLVGCTANDNRVDSNTDSEYSKPFSAVESYTPEEQAKEGEKAKELRKQYDKERKEKYRYYFGDSDSYAETETTNAAGIKIKVFVDPEKAFEQSKTDYKEAYDQIKKEFGLQPISKNNIDDYITFGWQCTVDNPELNMKCGDLSSLLYQYKSSFSS